MTTTNYDHSSQHIFKHTARYVMGHSIRGARKALFLPGENALCVEVAFQCGAINKQTDVVLYEGNSDPRARAKIVKKIHLRMKEIGVVKYEIREKNILNDKLESDFDLAYLDFCGQMTEKVFNFLRVNNVLLSKIPVGYTFSLKPRMNTLYQETFGDYDYTNIKYPTNAQFLSADLKASDVSDWTICKFFEAIQAYERCWELETLINYKEEGQAIPMVFFSTKLEGKVIPHKPKRKARRGRKPKNSKTPKGYTPQQWAWAWENPNSIRYNK